jgi:hypothetical protein
MKAAEQWCDEMQRAAPACSEAEAKRMTIGLMRYIQADALRWAAEYVADQIVPALYNEGYSIPWRDALEALESHADAIEKGA